MRHELKSWHIYCSGYLSIRNRYFLIESSFYRIKASKDVIFAYFIIFMNKLHMLRRRWKKEQVDRIKITNESGPLFRSGN